MQYFERDGKFNFVDEHNAFVGYDSYQSCCEHADWFLADEVMPYRYDMDLCQELDWENWEFDQDFFQEVNDGHLDGGGMVCFRITHKSEDRCMYLHIFNSHNGYYGHGFRFSVNNNIKHEGYL